MKPLPQVGAAALALLFVSTVFAQPANDSCFNAESISGFGFFFFDNAGADTDGIPNDACNFFGSNEIYNDVWFCWTATESGTTIVRTCQQATLDTKIAVFDGCSPCPEAGGILACNDDSCSLQSSVSFVATAGNSYLIRLGTFSASAFGNGFIEVASNVVGGPLVNPANGHTYYLLNTSSWTAAEAEAVRRGGHLVTINDADENEWVRVNLANFDNTDRRVWIGFNDQEQEGNFVWVSGEPVTYTNWNGGEPNDSGGVEDFTELFGSNGQWNDNRDTPTGVIVYGTVEISEEAPTPADTNCDGSIDFFDIDPFLLALFDPAEYANQYPNCDINTADVNGDHSVDFFDIDPFIAALFGG